jgi:hypothetical protein
MFGRSRRTFEELGDLGGVANALVGMGVMSRLLDERSTMTSGWVNGLVSPSPWTTWRHRPAPGDFTSGRCGWPGASEAVSRNRPGARPPRRSVFLSDPREAARGTLTDSEIEAAWAAGQAMSLEAALAYAREPS